jgi:hypothetical protein
MRAFLRSTWPRDNKAVCYTVLGCKTRDDDDEESDDDEQQMAAPV